MRFPVTLPSQFRAISMQLYGTQSYHMEIRNRICDCMLDKDTQFGVYFENEQVQMALISRGSPLNKSPFGMRAIAESWSFDRPNASVRVQMSVLRCCDRAKIRKQRALNTV